MWGQVGAAAVVVAMTGVAGCSAPVASAPAPAASSAPSAPAPAGGASGVTSKELSRGSADGKDYILREITIAPGGSTGWHFHDGELHGWVVAGTLTHFDHNCAVDGVYQPGQAVTEPAGAEHFHVGRNVGTQPMVLDVVYVLPAGKPLAENIPKPPCDRS